MKAPIMTLEQLRVFVEAAERLHMTQAAAAVNLTQSAASAAIHALEARLNSHLFDRVGRRLELTEAGRVLVPDAKAILFQGSVSRPGARRAARPVAREIAPLGQSDHRRLLATALPLQVPRCPPRRQRRGNPVDIWTTHPR
jgi:DNA-binding transcriptional LysR family regulator